MNLTWRRNIPEASSLSLPISHVSSNKGALLLAIRLVWPQCSCDVLLLGSYSHFQCCIGMTLGPVTAWFGVQISSLHVHTLGMVFACSEFCGQHQANINKPRKNFPPAGAEPYSGNCWHSSLMPMAAAVMQWMTSKCFPSLLNIWLFWTPLHFPYKLSCESFVFLLLSVCFMAGCAVCSGGHCPHCWLLYASFTPQELSNMSQKST